MAISIASISSFLCVIYVLAGLHLGTFGVAADPVPNKSPPQAARTSTGSFQFTYSLVHVTIFGSNTVPAISPLPPGHSGDKVRDLYGHVSTLDITQSTIVGMASFHHVQGYSGDVVANNEDASVK